MGRLESKTKPLPDAGYLNMLLQYEATDGLLRWKERLPSSFTKVTSRTPEYAARHWNSKCGGKLAGSVRGTGYVTLMIDGVAYQAHRIIWKMLYGEEPLAIDHINGNKADNREGNLRNVSSQVNAKNRRLYANNKSGVNGVSYHKRDNQWQARISIGKGQDVHLGNFQTRDEAIAARVGAQIVLGYHENHGLQTAADMKKD